MQLVEYLWKAATLQSHGENLMVVLRGSDLPEKRLSSQCANLAPVPISGSSVRSKAELFASPQCLFISIPIRLKATVRWPRLAVRGAEASGSWHSTNFVEAAFPEAFPVVAHPSLLLCISNIHVANPMSSNVS